MKHIRVQTLPAALEFDAVYYVATGAETCDAYVVSRSGYVRKVSGGGAGGGLEPIDFHEHSVTASVDGEQSILLPIIPVGLVSLFINGLRQPSAAYTIASNTVSVPADMQVMTGDTLSVEYIA